MQSQSGGIRGDGVRSMGGGQTAAPAVQDDEYERMKAELLRGQ